MSLHFCCIFATLSLIMSLCNCIEWIEQNIYPYLIKMEKLMENSVNLKKAKTWPKRPLKPLEDLKRYSIGTDQANNNNNYGK